MVSIIKLIKQIPGPDFLIMFAILSIIVYIFLFYWTRIDKTLNNNLPRIEGLSLYELSYLSGGSRRTTETALYNLWLDRSIEVAEDYTFVRSKSISKPKDEIEYELLKFIKSPRTFLDIVDSELLRIRLQKHFDLIKNKFQNMKIFRTPKDLLKNGWVIFFSLLLIFGLGGMKFFLGMQNHKPVGNLAILIFLDCIFFFGGLTNQKKYTKLGKKLVDKIKRDFKWISHRLDKNELPDEVNHDFALALFGLSSCTGIAIMSPFTNNIPNYMLANYPKSSLGFMTTHDSFNDQTDYGCSGGGGCSDGGSGGCGNGGGCGGGCGGCGD